MYLSLTFSHFHLPYFLKSLSFTPKISYCCSSPKRRLCTPNRSYLTPILGSPSKMFSLTLVLLKCLSQFRRILLFLVVDITVKIYFVQSFLMSTSLQYQVNKQELSLV